MASGRGRALGRTHTHTEEERGSNSSTGAERLSLSPRRIHLPWVLKNLQNTNNVHFGSNFKISTGNPKRDGKFISF